MRGCQRAQQGAGAIPKYLHANAHKKKRGKPQDDTHPALTDESSEAVRKAIADENAGAHQSRADDSGEDCKQVRTQVMGLVSAKGDGRGDRAGTHRERESQRVEGAAKNVIQIHLFLNTLAAIYFLFALKRGPAIGNDNKAAAGLHNGDRDSEEVQDVSAHQKGSDQKKKAVNRDFARQNHAGGGRIFARQGEKNGAAAQGIHDGEQSAEDQQNALGNFQGSTPFAEDSISEQSPTGRFED